MATVYRVSVGDEEIEFEGPDGLTDAQIEDLAANELKTAKPGQVFERPEFGGAITPDGKPYEEQSYLERVKDNTESLSQFGAGLAQGTAKVLDQGANLLEGGYNQTLGRIFGESDSADVPAFQNLAAQLGEGDPAGQQAGSFLATALLTRGRGAGTQGSMDAVLNGEADTPIEYARDMALGFGGGKVGEKIAEGVSHIISPVVDKASQLLHSVGTKLTPGQAIPALREFEDKALSWPFVGTKIREGRQRSFDTFNRATVDEALKPVFGKGLPEKVKTGHEAIRYAGDRLSSRYGEIVPKLTFKADQQFASEIQGLRAKLASGEISPDNLKRVESMVRDGVMSRLTGPSANGLKYRAADKYLGEKIARYGRSTNPEDQAIAEVLGDLQASMSSALHRSNPKFAPELENINRGWSLLVPAESAAAQAKRGIFSADQYRTAIRQNDKRVRKRGMARGEARGQELAEAGSEVLPSQYPNPSGTASHEAYNPANVRFWQGLGARSLYGPKMQNALTGIALAPRPSFAPALAEGVKVLPAPLFGSGASINALSPLFTINPDQ